MYMHVNGQIVNEGEAHISPFDHGFLYGLGVFETFRIYDGHPFLLDDHINRINNSLKELHILYVCSRHEIEKILQELLYENGLRDARIRLNISAGAAPVGLQTSPYQRPNILLFMQQMIVPQGLQEKKGILLKTRRNKPETSERLKSHHYLNNMIAKREITANPDSEGIFLNEDGYLAEGIASNLFWVKDHTLYTPAIQTGILNGVTRQFVLKLAKKSGFVIQEGLYKIEDIGTADEVFCTNSIQEIFSVGEIKGIGSFQGRSGTGTSFLFEAYQTYRTLLYSRNEI
ncbi:4-amino-4-deoxychorismate lyase [Peribacillus cavernae]|uniref:4-amino-4-deoxychorismate lyase n=1 Tax=Peribacillus cavernae TaxID=1674310 RepID=A0A3S0VK29_9BACI|nr:aminodeoxychorismate lyase [Peribacillus cavernae]MDQ0220877.1 4-amino-4-deoxychorismate lyase [Peribacillus cavernae]RUQ27305.1 4-amino-4-deoxychorismate lyase [Peribacillus cavernae]